MLDRLDSREYVGVGRIGQCWNCPANAAKVCNGNIYHKYNPSYEEAIEIFKMHPPQPTRNRDLDRAFPMPFPECRLNEFGCLINVDVTRPLVMPQGDIVPFGTMSLDTGTDWFRAMVLRKFKFLNWYEGMVHGPFNNRRGGHEALMKEDIYSKGELAAKEYLLSNFDRPINSKPESH
jgi:hypothetical protein